jgi:hypothetical protein
LKTGDEEIMMIAKFAQERWVRSFLSTPVFTGTAQKEGGACKKTSFDFWVETKVLWFVFKNKKGGLS